MNVDTRAVSYISFSSGPKILGMVIPTFVVCPILFAQTILLRYVQKLTAYVVLDPVKSTKTDTNEKLKVEHNGTEDLIVHMKINGNFRYLTENFHDSIHFKQHTTLSILTFALKASLIMNS